MKAKKQSSNSLTIQEFKQLMIIVVVIAALLSWVIGFMVGNRHGISTQKDIEAFTSDDKEEHNHE